MSDSKVSSVVATLLMCALVLTLGVALGFQIGQHNERDVMRAQAVKAEVGYWLMDPISKESIFMWGMPPEKLARWEVALDKLEKGLDDIAEKAKKAAEDKPKPQWKTLEKDFLIFEGVIDTKMPNE